MYWVPSKCNIIYSAIQLRLCMVPDSTHKIMAAPFSNSFYGKGNKKPQLLTRLICYSEQSDTIVNKLMFTEFHKW